MPRQARWLLVVVTAAGLMVLLPRLGDYLVAQTSTPDSTSTTTGFATSSTTSFAAATTTTVLLPFAPPGTSGTNFGTAPAPLPSVTTTPTTPSIGSFTTPSSPSVAAGSASPASPLVGSAPTPGASSGGTATTGARTAALVVLALGLLGIGLQVRTSAVARLAWLGARPRWRHRRRGSRWWVP